MLLFLINYFIIIIVSCFALTFILDARTETQKEINNLALWTVQD